jgi:hypothetical protein
MYIWWTRLFFLNRGRGPRRELWQILAASATMLPMSALALGDFCTGGMMGSFHLLRL